MVKNFQSSKNRPPHTTATITFFFFKNSQLVGPWIGQE